MHNENNKVLLIEDDTVDQLAFTRLVEDEKLPCTYSIAGSVSEARRILSDDHFDIVISDYSLGDGTAFDAIDFQKDAPVIMITGVGNEEIAVRAMKKGAYDYLTKDLDRNYLKMLCQ
jgi:DNA-binding NtrC family response regulator